MLCLKRRGIDGELRPFTLEGSKKVMPILKVRNIHDGVAWHDKNIVDAYVNLLLYELKLQERVYDIMMGTTSNA